MAVVVAKPLGMPAFCQLTLPVVAVARLHAVPDIGVPPLYRDGAAAVAVVWAGPWAEILTSLLPRHSMPVLQPTLTNSREAL